MSEFRYQKICRLSRCRKSFGTNLKWQEFCKTPHRIEYHQTEIRDQKKLSKRVEDLEKEIHKKGGD